MARVSHPNVCRIYDIIDWEGAHFVAMEYVDGEDLSRLLKRIGRIAHDKAVDIARGIAAGLMAAHAKGILHRDLKPANIMIDSRGDARIMDFGLALAAGEDDGETRDPHVWLDPTNMAAIADAVADRLAEISPDHADAFHTRSDELGQQLTALDEEYSTRLADCERRIFVTSHAAFGYLAHRYDLEMVGISGIDPDAEPSPARLAEVQKVVQDEGVTTIFYERLVNPAVADALANDIGVQTAVLDPIEGLQPGATGDYFSIMRTNLTALRTALDCT